jgi:hypothetical protein
MCACVWGALEGLEYELANNGDDCVVFCEAEVAQEVNDRLASFIPGVGLPIEIEPWVYELEKVEFCQTRPVFDGSKWVMVRDPRVCLDKDNATLKPVRSQRDLDTLRKSVSLCGLALAGNMPVFCEFYKTLGRGAGDRVDRDEVETGFKMLARGMNQVGAVTDECRASFFRAFDITPAEQLALEDLFKSMTVKPFGHSGQERLPYRTIGSLMGCVI